MGIRHLFPLQGDMQRVAVFGVYLGLTLGCGAGVAMAQSAKYATSGMGGGQSGTARLQAQQAVTQSAITNISDCGNAGRIYGPAFTGNRSGNCLSDLTVNTTGGITVSGNSTISGTTTITGATTLQSSLTVAGQGSFSGNMDVAGNVQFNGAILAPEGNLRDDGGGWVRTYGATGWYSQSYGGGWYMSDASYIRTVGNKNVYTGGEVRSGAMYSGTANFNDVYIRGIGRWASSIGKPYSCSWVSSGLTWLHADDQAHVVQCPYPMVMTGWQCYASEYLDSACYGLCCYL